MTLVPHSSAELIGFIESSDYTDIIFDFDKTLYHLIIEWSSFKNNMIAHKQKT